MLSRYRGGNYAVQAVVSPVRIFDHRKGDLLFVPHVFMPEAKSMSIVSVHT